MKPNGPSSLTQEERQKLVDSLVEMRRAFTLEEDSDAPPPLYMFTQPHFEIIPFSGELDIASVMSPEPEPKSTSLTGWEKRGDFSVYNSGGDLNRQITFCNLDKNAAYIKKIKILGYRDGDINLVVTAKDKQAYDHLYRIVSQAGLSIPDDAVAKLLLTIGQKEQHLDHCEQFMNLLSGVEVSLQEKVQEIVQIIKANRIQRAPFIKQEQNDNALPANAGSANVSVVPSTNESRASIPSIPASPEPITIKRKRITEVEKLTRWSWNHPNKDEGCELSKRKRKGSSLHI